MEIEKTLSVAAPAADVWQLLLDPNVMGACVPGMQSIEVISDVEYVSVIQVKIAFISARFRIKTNIVEMRAPHYLRTEGTGEDASVASSLKQRSELFLTALPDGGTEIRARVEVDVLGRLGTFGLSVMKTKADRMWDEFCRNLVQRLENPGSIPAAGTPSPSPSPSPSQSPAAGPASPVSRAAPAAAETPGAAAVLRSAGGSAEPAAAPAAAPSVAMAAALASPLSSKPSVSAPGPDVPAAPVSASSSARPSAVPAAAPPARAGWLARLFGAAPATAAAERGPLTDICIEVRRPHETITVRWPVQQADACSAWLRELVK